MRVLVTGGAGQVGSHVVELLLERGDDVVVLDNLATGRTVHLENAPKVDFRVESIAKRESFSNLWPGGKGPDVIVHTAASYSDGNAWEEDVETNIHGTINATRLAKESGARVIYFQTALCYGSAPTEQPVSLGYPRQPAPSSYAISKTAGEMYIEQSGVDFVTFRLANIVGPRNLSGPLPIFYKRLTEGIPCMIAEARRDFVDVRDLATVVVQAVDGAGNGAYHFSSGGDISIMELFEVVAKELGFEALPEFQIPPTSNSNPTTILLDPTRTYTDFEMPKLRGIDQTVSAAMDYYKKYGVTREVTHMKPKQ